MTAAPQLEFQWIARDERPRAPLMVFLHEGLGSVSAWRDFPQQLCEAGGLRGLVYSRPGYGRSPPGDRDRRWTPDFMHEHAREALPRLLDVLHVDAERERVWLFGHSDGGSIALLHASMFPRRVRATVVMAPHLFVEDLSIQGVARARDAYRETDWRARLGRHHDDVDAVFHRWSGIWLDPAFRGWNIEREVAQLRCPVLALQGVDDEYGSLRQIERIAELLPRRARLLKLDGCGHSPHRDRPQAVIEATLRFVQEHADT